MIMSCTEVGPLLYWPNEERCAPQQMYCDMGRSRGIAILRGATCSARTLTHTYTWIHHMALAGILAYTLLTFTHHLLPAHYPCKLTDFFPSRTVSCEVYGCPWPLAAGS